MRVAIFGLGYVGCTSAACLAGRGVHVIGVDVNPLKVEMVSRGESPIIEGGIPERLAAAVGEGRLRVTGSAEDAIQESDVSLVCVGTPSKDNGSLDLGHLEKAVESLGEALRTVDHYHVVAVRSTVLPGTIEGDLIPLVEATSGKRAGRSFGVCSNPEFLREGEAVEDFENPPFTLIGELDPRSGETVAELYRGLKAPLIRTGIRVAEGVKYASNCYHALKIGFANEMGVLFKSLGVDPFAVLDVFTRDTRLNISAAYLRPGFAFGGSCLPKDLRALLYAAKRHDLDLPLLGAVLPGNETHFRRGLDLVLKTGRKKVGILGFSFKAGTDDLRESPLVGLVEALLGKGFSLKIYDRHVSLAKLFGANREYIENVIPHISTLMCPDLDEVLKHSEVVVIGNRDPEFRQIPEQLREEQVLIDLVRIRDDVNGLGPSYQGISW